MKPLVYVAGPLSGEMLSNTLRAIEVGDDLLRLGFAPVIPHLSLFWHYHRPHDYETWMDLDFALLSRCDALFRMDGKSQGADREVAEADRLGIPAYYSLSDLAAQLLPASALDDASDAEGSRTVA